MSKCNFPQIKNRTQLKVLGDEGLMFAHARYLKKSEAIFLVVCDPSVNEL
jgi:hypothetical protein